jgi:hypothetical protein
LEPTIGKISAKIIGMLFILATAMGVLSGSILWPMFKGPDYLTAMSKTADLVMLSTALNIIMAGSVVAIAVVFFPILKRTHETLAYAFLAGRIIEGILLAIAGLIWLNLVSLGNEFVQVGSPDASYFQTLADMLVTLSTSIFTLGAEIVFGISAVILNYILLRANLIPKVISIWGLIGGIFLSLLGAMKILGMEISAVEIAFTVPIALSEMVLAAWLIFKGFNGSVQNI